MKNIPYTAMALVLTAPIFRSLGSTFKYHWKRQVVFESDVAVCHTEGPRYITYSAVESIRFSYGFTLHTSTQYIIFSAKAMSGGLGTRHAYGIVLWDLSGFSLGAVGQILLELCARSPVSSVLIETPLGSDVEPQVRHILMKIGELKRDRDRQQFIFTPFGTPVC